MTTDKDRIEEIKKTGDDIDTLYYAYDLLEQTIDLLQQVANSQQDINHKAYLIDHLKNWMGGENSNRYDSGILDWIKELEMKMK